LSNRARDWRRLLSEQILPYWFDTALDRDAGGYRLGTDKQLVGQSRLLWVFSHAHTRGFRDLRRDFLSAAEQGYRFLRERFFDPRSGGYSWTTDRAGRPLDGRKILYGQSFVILAFVEYFRATGENTVLQAARELFQLIQAHARDSEGRYTEHFRRDWTPIEVAEPGIEPPRPGWLSANFAVHWMESLSELAAESGQADIREALGASVEAGARLFFDPDASVRPAYRRADGRPLALRPRPRNFVTRLFPPLRGAAKIVPVGPGHLVEQAWLRVRAERVLGRRPSWDAFDRTLDAALTSAFDDVRGGMAEEDGSRVWWTQAELLAALTEAVASGRKARFGTALGRQLDWLQSRQTDPGTGILWEAVRPDGTVANASRAHHWKAGYHEVRALVKFVEAFEAPGRSAITLDA
jgi:mannobiose 2-epimerase